MEFFSPERGGPSRIHANRRAIHDGVKELPPQIGPRHDLHTSGLGQTPGALRTPRTNPHNRSGLCERKRSRSRCAARTQQKNAAPRQAHAAFQAPQHADVIRIVPVEPPASTHDHRIDSADARGQRIAVAEKAQNGLLVRNCDRKARYAERLHCVQKIAQSTNEERHKHGVHVARAERRIVNKGESEWQIGLPMTAYTRVRRVMSPAR
jgi:hypothetical protein